MDTVLFLIRIHPLFRKYGDSFAYFALYDLRLSSVLCNLRTTLLEIVESANELCKAACKINEDEDFEWHQNICMVKYNAKEIYSQFQQINGIFDKICENGFQLSYDCFRNAEDIKCLYSFVRDHQIDKMADPQSPIHRSLHALPASEQKDDMAAVTIQSMWKMKRRASQSRSLDLTYAVDCQELEIPSTLNETERDLAIDLIDIIKKEWWTNPNSVEKRLQDADNKVKR